MTFILYFFFFILILEVILFFFINKVKKNFQWLITEKEEFPDFKTTNIESFFKSSFDKNLGWLKRPDITDFHDKTKKKTTFSIDKRGARKSKYNNFKKKIEAYGDSYTFGRFVNDDQVWTEILSKNLKCHVINYGVGNYGFDQALLRHEKNKNSTTVYTIIGVVPETINRINSIWKHYLEFGNIYGFKPSFFLKGNKLKFRKNPIINQNSFHKKKIVKIIRLISKNDYFYINRFKKFQFRKPYILSFFRNFSFNCKLFLKIYLFLLSRQNNKKKFFFPLYYQNNIESANNLYTIKETTQLFKLLIKRFKDNVEKRSSIPVIIIFPQKKDIELFRKGENYYCNFFNSIRDIKIIDLTKFLSKRNMKKIYFDDEYGGHLTAYGNRIVAIKIQQEFKDA